MSKFPLLKTNMEKGEGREDKQLIMIEMRIEGNGERLQISLK